MKLANVTLVSAVAVLGLVTVGCASRSETSTERLDTNESQLVEDNSEATDADETMESAVEEPLSGAEPVDPGTPADGADEATLQAKLRTNPGKWFLPAGCITTTFAGNVATHVFKDCTGPYGLASFNGTVTTTYARTASSLTITHSATGFKVNGASITGNRQVVYTRSGTVITKHRTGTWGGTTKNGRVFTHEADFTATWDSATKCITRDGTATTNIAARELSLTISGFKRCGVGHLGCPESGTLVLQRSRGDATAKITIVFEGGREVTVTRPNGSTVTRQLACKI